MDPDNPDVWSIHESCGELLDAQEKYIQAHEWDLKDFAPSYMDECMWRERYLKTQKLAYINLLKHMAEMYPC